jgi:uncharacterized protein (DUF1800 family)
MTSLISAPVFWEEAGRRQMIKSPFELAVSALRALDAEVVETEVLGDWIARMGQPLYNFNALTGLPDRGGFWIDAGTL